MNTSISTPHVITATPQEPVVPRPTMRILHLINGEHFAGAERVQDLLAIALPACGYQLEFASLKEGAFGSVRQSTVPLHQFRMRSAIDFSAYWNIKRLVDSGGYHILHAHTPRTLMIGALVAQRTGLPLVYHVHSPVGRDSTRSLRNRINAWVETRSLKTVRAVICVSASLWRYMQELGHPANKLHVVRNGVPTVHRSTVRSLPRCPWILGTMALFRPRKGIENLLESMAILKQRGLDVCLRAVGGFESAVYQQQVLELAERLGIESSICWTGFQTDTNCQLNQMDLFILPSLFGEGLPMVVLESMAQGLPVIASNVEGIPEVVRDGIDGLIFQAGSSQDLADKIESIHGDINRWQEFSRQARQLQCTELSDTSMAAGVARVYDQITQRGC